MTPVNQRWGRGEAHEEPRNLVGATCCPGRVGPGELGERGRRNFGTRTEGNEVLGQRLDGNSF